MEYRHILYSTDEGIARVTLNRPEVRNAQSRRLLEEMDDAFRVAVDDPEVRVIILSGNGGRLLRRTRPRLREETRRPRAAALCARLKGRYKRLWDLYIDFGLRWRNLPKPTIAMVHGYCIFGGWMIATAMDLIVAADDARFLASHFQYFSVPYDLGIRKAKDVLFQFRFLHADEAEKTGLRLDCRAAGRARGADAGAGAADRGEPSVLAAHGEALDQPGAGSHGLFDLRHRRAAELHGDLGVRRQHRRRAATGRPPPLQLRGPRPADRPRGRRANR